MQKLNRLFFYLGLLFAIVSCKQDHGFPFGNVPQTLPKGFPPINFPDDNLPNRDRIELGKRLFFDPILSIDSSISCGSCHFPEKAFADSRSISPGVNNRLGFRNAPSLLNIAYHPYLLKDGGSPTLETQALVPIHDYVEMDFNLIDASTRINRIKWYSEKSNSAYKKHPSAYVITRALAAYQRSLISGDSKYDRYKNGAKSILSELEKKGVDLFFSDRTNCSSCHTGFNFTNYEFENNGLYLEYSDSGRARITYNIEDGGKFKVPSLRNVAKTSPYMHDGSVSDLRAVIDHYNVGGKSHVNQNPMIRPLNLSEPEILALIAFLESLTEI